MKLRDAERLNDGDKVWVVRAASGINNPPELFSYTVDAPGNTLPWMYTLSTYYVRIKEGTKYGALSANAVPTLLYQATVPMSRIEKDEASARLKYEQLKAAFDDKENAIQASIAARRLRYDAANKAANAVRAEYGILLVVEQYHGSMREPKTRKNTWKIELENNELEIVARALSEYRRAQEEANGEEASESC